MNKKLEYFCLAATLAVVWLGFKTIPELVDRNMELQDRIVALEKNATKLNNLAAAQAKFLRERPVVYRHKTIYKELP